MKGRSGGFSLIEIMIVVAVMAILASIAYPSYTEHMRKARRSDATSTLLKLAQELERCYTEKFSYANCIAASTTSSKGYYTITAAVSESGDTFTLSAAPVTGMPQAQDSKCTKFTLNSAGVRGAEGSKPSICW